MKIVNKDWLEAKINELNNWLQSAESQGNCNYAQKEAARNYYVAKLIEMEESGLTKIQLK